MPETNFQRRTSRISMIITKAIATALDDQEKQRAAKADVKTDF